jgi:4-hydroxybenzoyl-CoA thioesterase
LTGAFEHVHRVRFDEVDAAGIVYFPRFFTWCHDAMEALLTPIDYADLVRRRRLGLPAVHAEADYTSPVRFGDEVRVAVVVERIGTSSCALRFDLSHGERRVATLRHVVAATDLDAMRARPLPDDVRAAFQRHLVMPG